MGAEEIAGSGGSSIELWLSGSDEPFSDVRLQARIWEELHEDARLEGAELRVEVVDGAAVLDGTVDQVVTKTLAERAARRVDGLRSVESHIQVRSHDSSGIHCEFMHP
jgi:osmotically-inducible protein OsmY